MATKQSSSVATDSNPQELPLRSLPPLITAGLTALMLAGCSSASMSSSTERSQQPAATSATTTSWHENIAEGSSGLERLACPGNGICWATGENGRIFHLSDGHWVQFASPTTSSLYGISCPSMTDCWAVGALAPTASEAPSSFIEHYDGRTWTQVASPSYPGVPESGLFAVSCPSETDCWAAGIGGDQNSTPRIGHLLVLHFAGRRWVLASAPSPQAGDSTNADALIACYSSRQCILLRSFAIEEEHSDAEAGDIFTGRNWSTLDVPSTVLIQGLSCVRTNDCYAIGGENSNGPMSDYHFDGRSWTPGPQLPDTLEGHPVAWRGLSCLSHEACWAVGGAPVSTTDASGPAVVARLENGAWAFVSSPRHLGELRDVACLAPSRCWAVGAAPTSGATVSPGPLAMQLGS